jgi:hypothetical protein
MPPQPMHSCSSRLIQARDGMSSSLVRSALLEICLCGIDACVDGQLLIESE